MTIRTFILTSAACCFATGCTADSLPRTSAALAAMPPSLRPAPTLVAAVPAPAMPGRRVVPYAADPWTAPAASPAPTPPTAPVEASPVPVQADTAPRTSSGAISLHPPTTNEPAADALPSAVPPPVTPAPVAPVQTAGVAEPVPDRAPPIAVPEAPPVGAPSPAPEAPPAPPEPPPPPPEPPLPFWTIVKGETYRDVMNRAAREAGYNEPIYDFADPDDDWEIRVTPPPYQGTFEDFVAWLTKGVSHKLPRPFPTISKSAKSILVVEVN